MDLKSYLPGYTAKVKSGSNVRVAPHIGSMLDHATTTDLPVGVIGTVIGDVDPANGSNIWYALWHDSRVEYTAKDNIIGLTAPAAADCSVQNAKITAQEGFIKAQADAISALNVERDALAAKQAVDGPEAEESRVLRSALTDFLTRT